MQSGEEKQAKKVFPLCPGNEASEFKGETERFTYIESRTY